MCVCVCVCVGGGGGGGGGVGVGVDVKIQSWFTDFSNVPPSGNVSQREILKFCQHNTVKVSCYSGQRMTLNRQCHIIISKQCIQ